MAKKLVQNGEKPIEIESYYKQLQLSNIKCRLTKYGTFQSLLWEKMYTLAGSACRSVLRSHIGFNKHNKGPFSHIVTTFSIQGHPSKITIVTPCLTLFLNLLKTIFKMYIAGLKAISRKGSCGYHYK